MFVFLLSVIGPGTVLAEMVFFQNVFRDGSESRVQGKSSEGHLCAHLKGDRIIQGVLGVLSEGEGSVV